MYNFCRKGTNCWDYLSQPIKEECYPEITKVLYEMKMSEEKNVAIASEILAAYTK